MRDYNLSSLKDIMPSQEIPTALLSWAMMLLCIALFLALGYRYLKKHSPQIPDTKAEIRNRLKALNLHAKDTKAMLYQFTLDAKKYQEGEPSQALESILRAQEPYKYHAKPITLDTKLREKIAQYIEALS